MLDLILKQKFSAKVVTLVRRINCYKWLYSVDNKFMVVWKLSKNQIDYLDYIKEIAPKIYKLNNDYLAQDWIEQKETTTLENLNPKYLVQLHSKVKRKISDSWLKPIDSMWQNLNQNQQTYVTENLLSWHEMQKYILSIIPEYGYLLHGDIHPGNLIKIKEQLFLIDWEWMCIGPVEFDLAMLKQYLPYDKFNLFIKNYSKTIPIDQKLLHKLEQLCLFRCSLWALSNSNNKIPEKSTICIQEFRSKLINNKFEYTEDEFSMLAYASIKAIDLEVLK